MRIVSLLPSATEIVYALGLGDQLAGVTFECDEPARARTDNVLVVGGLDTAGMTPGAIDASVRARLAAGEDLYTLHADALAGLAPDLILTQDLCRVCALPAGHVSDALDYLGCTAEVVYVDGRNVVVGHVGDSRTYHLHDGRLIQLTRDQTLVNRLVELGQLTAEEAENHPRKNELQQAVGGQPDVEPGVYHGTLKPGDWVLVCSDGVSNHVKDRELAQMLQGEAVSAEMAARRLVNLVNIEGATDNATIVVVRAT